MAIPNYMVNSICSSALGGGGIKGSIFDSPTYYFFVVGRMKGGPYYPMFFLMFFCVWVGF